MINLNYTKPKTSIQPKTEVINTLKNSIDNSDMILITKLSNLRNTLNKENLNMKSVRQQINEISKFDQIQNFDYLSNMLRPEKAKGCKIPSQIPVPSCAFQLHNSITLSTNATGNLAVMFNPFFLASNTALGVKLATDGNAAYSHKFLSSLWVNRDDSLTGAASNDHWVPYDIGQVIPPVYEQYRLVSASMVVKYIGRLDTVQGLVGGAIFFDDSIDMGGGVFVGAAEDTPYNPNGDVTLTECPALSKYGNFDLAEDSFYQCQNMTLEGVRELYFPVDNSFEEYHKTMDNTIINAQGGDEAPYEYAVNEDVFRSGFNWFFYATGAPFNSNCFKLDIYCNFECLPNAQFLNYMPISLNPYRTLPEEKQKVIYMLQQKPIMKSNEDKYDEVGTPNLFNKMIKKFDNGLPGFEKLSAWGLMNAIPALKPGIALAGNMIQTNMMVDEVE